MTKLIKLLLGLTLVLTVTIIVVVAGALLYFDPNEHKDFIVSKVEKATGRSFAISGNIDLTFYPWLGLEADGITLGNADGFGDEPFLYADMVALRIKTMPLFKKQYELDTLRLHGLDVYLARNREGVTNWDDLVREPAEKKGDPLQFAAVVLGGVDIKDAQITWQDKTSDRTIRITDMNVTTGELIYGAPVNLKVTLKSESSRPDVNSDLKLDGVLNYNLDTEIYSFKPVDLVAKLTGKDVPGGSADLVLKAAIESNLGTDTVQVDDLGLDVLGTSINGVLTASKVSSGKPDTTAQLTVKSSDLAPLLSLIDPEAAAELKKVNDRSADIKLNVSASAGQGNIQISRLDAKLLGANIQGQVDAGDLQSSTPSAKGMLKATGPDLPALMQVIGQFETGKEPRLRDYGQKLSKVTDKSFDVSAEFDADLAGGNIHVPNLSVKALGITADGQLDAKGMNTSSGKVDGKFVLHGEKLAPVLAAMDQKALGEVLQVIDIDAGVSGTGKEITLSPLAVKATFAGKQIPDSPAAITFNADTRVNLENESLAINNMKLQGLGLNVAGNVNAAGFMSGKPAVNARLDARGNDLALVFKLAGIEPLATQLAGLQDRSFDIKTGLDADPGKGNIKISGLDAKMLGATINGDIDAANIQSETPSAKGRLKATGPDLPALMQVIGQFETGKEPKLKEYGQRLAKVDNRAFDIAADFDADLGKGNINIPALTAKSMGIDMNGRLDARNMNSNSASIDGKLLLKGEKMAGVLNAFGQAGLAEVMQALIIDAGIKGTGGDFVISPLQIKTTFAGKQIPNSPVDMTLGANTRANMDKQTLVIENLSLQGLGLNVKSNINATQILDKPAFNGNLSVAEFNLRQLAQQLNQELPETADKNVFNKVALTTGISGSSDSLALTDLSLLLDESRMKGNLSVAKFTQPDIQFAIGIDAINADRYLPPSAEGKPVTPETTAAGAASELPLDTLRSLRVNGELTVGQLVLSNAKMTDIQLAIKARDGDIRLDPVSAALYQGKYEGTVVMDARGKVPNVVINTRLTGVNLDPLLKDYMQQPESPLAGIADISFDQLTASGSDADQIRKSLAGKGKFNVTDGILRGVDVNKTLEQVEIMIESKSFGNVNTEGETPFRQLSGTLDIEQGVVKNKDMLMTATGFNLTGKGTIANLNNETIQYDMKVKVDETSATRGEKRYNIGGYEIPVNCRGKLNKPDCKPDLGDIAKVLLQKGGEEKLRGFLEKSLGIESTTPATTTPAETTIEQPATQVQPATQEQQSPATAEQPATQEQQPAATEQETTTSKKKKKKSTEDQLKEGLEDALKGLFE
jgi:AsmA protein